jgi:hypothetical protein
VPFVLAEEPGAIVAGFDVHRRQITVEALDTATGEVSRGQIESTPAAVEEWVVGFPGRMVHVAVEACTGWLFVCRALDPASRPPLRPSPPITDAPTACGQLPQLSRHPRPAWRPTKDTAAAVAPTERPINHQVTGRHHARPRAQIRQGVHGAKHSPHPASLRRDHPRPAGDPPSRKHTTSTTSTHTHHGLDTGPQLR